MKFSASTILFAALGAFFAPGVAADPHYECSCSTWNGRGWTYDWQLTFNACKNNYEGEVRISLEIEVPRRRASWTNTITGQLQPWSGQGKSIHSCDNFQV